MAIPTPSRRKPARPDCSHHLTPYWVTTCADGIVGPYSTELQPELVVPADAVREPAEGGGAGGGEVTSGGGARVRPRLTARQKERVSCQGHWSAHSSPTLTV